MLILYVSVTPNTTYTLFSLSFFSNFRHALKNKSFMHCLSILSQYWSISVKIEQYLLMLVQSVEHPGQVAIIATPPPPWQESFGQKHTEIRIFCG